MFIAIILAITTATAGGYAGYLHFKHSAQSQAKTTINTQLRAEIATDINKILNALRADEKLLTTHPYQIISRIRAELREIL